VKTSRVRGGDHFIASPRGGKNRNFNGKSE
jgi:hypothetical protein